MAGGKFEYRMTEILNRVFIRILYFENCFGFLAWDFGFRIMKEHIIIRIVAKFFVPFIQLYAFYVIAHGDVSPGGGFQGGVILGASMILYVIAFGMDEGRKRVSKKISDPLMSTGALIYAGIGILCILAGGEYLEYAKLPLGPHHLASHLGMYGIEIGVGITVAFVMITIFFETARRERE